MGRRLMVWSLAIAWLGTMAFAADDPPPLAGPVAPSATKPDPSAPDELPQGLEVEPLPNSNLGPVLAIPGSVPLRSSAPVPSPSLEPPPLVGPAETPGAGSPLGAWPNLPNPGSAARSIPLQTVPAEALDAPTVDPRRGRSANPRDDLLDEVPPPPPRRSRLFGRWPLPLMPRGRASNRDDSITLEPRSDPAADAALKRRLERQIAEVAGHRIRSVDVRVTDREIAIHARVTRFWYRRSVKRAIENLPGLVGYRTRVIVED
jgi:hypothetical protein